MQGICPAGGFLETLCQLPQPPDCFISHDCKTSHQYMGTIPDSAASWRCRLVLLDHRSSCLCAPLWVSLVKQFLGDHFHQGTLKTLPVWAVPKRIDKWLLSVNHIDFFNKYNYFVHLYPVTVTGSMLLYKLLVIHVSLLYYLLSLTHCKSF